MSGLNHGFRQYTPILALSAVVAVASAQRAVLPDRIGWKEEFGGSKFAESLHDLSEQGKLDGDTSAQPEAPAHFDHNRYYYRHLHRWYDYRGRHGRYWDPYYDPYPYGVDGRVATGVQPGSQLAYPAVTTPTPTQPAPPPEPPTTIEQARFDFAAGREEKAIDEYRKHLADNPDDFGAATELASALIAEGRSDDGVALMRFAYGSDPGLATHPISERVLLTSRQWRDVVIRAVKHAHKRDTASAWLAVAVLMQAENRDTVGLRMLRRAEQRGLDRAVTGPLAAAMR